MIVGSLLSIFPVDKNSFRNSARISFKTSAFQHVSFFVIDFLARNIDSYGMIIQLRSMERKLDHRVNRKKRIIFFVIQKTMKNYQESKLSPNLERLDQKIRRLEVQIRNWQKPVGANSNVCRSYCEKTGRGSFYPCPLAPLPTSF